MVLPLYRPYQNKNIIKSFNYIKINGFRLNFPKPSLDNRNCVLFLHNLLRNRPVLYIPCVNAQFPRTNRRPTFVPLPSNNRQKIQKIHHFHQKDHETFQFLQEIPNNLRQHRHSRSQSPIHLLPARRLLHEYFATYSAFIMNAHD